MADSEDADAAPSFQDELTGAIPHLRAFARSLCGDPVEADDLVQETLVKAWKAQDRFKPGTSIRAWTFMILRNHFYSERRRAWRKSERGGEIPEAALTSNGAQDGAMDLDDLRRALDRLPSEQREALVLVGAGGFSYEEAAEICGCAVGTVKSRVSRARNAVEALLSDSADLAPSKNTAASGAEDFVDYIHRAAAERSAS
ncbi:sigma-70 family RNA polymerase sigma factor [Marinicauda salina]|nr:sigma-70 family RNA polymerase sigma factor [Marinicauda salina]